MVVEQGKVSLRTVEEALPLGAAPTGSWSTLRLETAGDSTTVSLSGGKPVTIEHRPLATWLYLGEGYPDRDTPTESSVLIDVESARTRVIASPAAACLDSGRPFLPNWPKRKQPG